MKRIVALMLSLLLLFACCAAAEETESSGASMASTLDLSNLSISVVDNGRVRSVRLRDMSLRLTLGSTEGVPTMLVGFDNGKGQAVDAVVQVEESELLLAVGGISGVFYVDLESITGEEGDGARVAMGYGKALMLAGPHLDVLLMALPTTDAKGVHTLDIGLPNRIYTPVAEAMLSVAEGMDSVDDVDVSELRKRVDNSNRDAVLSLRYKQSTGEFELSATQDGRGFQLSATMEMTIEPTEMANISLIEERYDLMDLDEETLEELRNELEIIALKFGSFAGGSGLSRILR